MDGHHNQDSDTSICRADGPVKGNNTRYWQDFRAFSGKSAHCDGPFLVNFFEYVGLIFVQVKEDLKGYLLCHYLIS